MQHTYYGDPILRKKAERVEEVTDELRKFMHEFAEYAVSLNALGMAAPQVKKSIAVIVIRIPLNEGFEPPRIIINPKISNPSKELWTYPEGNYVLPGIQEEVVRPISITLEGQDINGNPFKEDLKGMPARIVMHENDHLNGVLFIDRLSQKVRKTLDPHLHKIKSMYNEV